MKLASKDVQISLLKQQLAAMQAQQAKPVVHVYVREPVVLASTAAATATATATATEASTEAVTETATETDYFAEEQHQELLDALHSELTSL